MTALIEWNQLPRWVPGRILLQSDELGWKNVGLRSYHYQGQDVIVPAMRDYMLVSYRQGVTPMQRRFDGKWRKETLSPGAVSFLTRAQRAFWNWRNPVEVTHVYLSGALVTEVASEVFDCQVPDVRLADVLRTEDPVVTAAMNAIAAEAKVNGLGGSLYVDSIARGLVVHLLRHYASAETSPFPPKGELSPQRKRVIADFIESHLAEPLDLAAMASELGMTPCVFARQFRNSFGKPAYSYVIERRLERARELLLHTALPIKQIAGACGFTDQAHMTRLFTRAHGLPPAAYRRSARPDRIAFDLNHFGVQSNA